MANRVYIDGHVGTTGLRIRDWLAAREDLALLTLPDAVRKDAAARRELVLEADLAVLCLPDDAAREAATWAEEGATKLLDASRAGVAPGLCIFNARPANPAYTKRAKQLKAPLCVNEERHAQISLQM